MGYGHETAGFSGAPMGEQPVGEWMSAGPVVADTFAGRIHVEWDNSATVTPLGQLPFFIEYLKQGGLFDGWVADCPLHHTSPNAPNKRDGLGTVLLSVLAGALALCAHDGVALRSGKFSGDGVDIAFTAPPGVTVNVTRTVASSHPNSGSA